MDKDYKYAAEYAKSDRSSCKSCKNNISKDSLRMAIMVQSSHFDGKIPNWYHFDCFFKKAKLINLEDIKNIDILRWEDQEKIKSKMKIMETEIEFDEFSIEYSKAKASKCVKCDEKIEKSEIRFSRRENKSSQSKKTVTSKLWYHIECLLKIKVEVTNIIPNFEIEKIPGFDKLNDDDKEDLRNKFKSWKSLKRPASDNKNESLAKKPKKTESDKFGEKLKKQNELLWNVRDQLNGQMAKSALVYILEHNNQYVPKGESDLLNSVADLIVFGCLNPCPECGGKLSYSSNGYKCCSIINEWTNCIYETKEVVRSKIAIPEEYSHLPLLKNYVYKKRSRILPKEIIKPLISNPLKGFTICIDRSSFGEGFTVNKMSQQIKVLGGEMSTTLSKMTLVVISSKNTVNQNDDRETVVFKAKLKSIHVVSSDFLDNVGKESDNVIDSIKKYSICDWGRSDEELRNLTNMISKDKRGGEKNSYSLEEKQIMKVKGGAAVDPDSGLEEKAHTFQDRDKQTWNAILGMTDLVSGINSYYKLQLLESDKGKKWWVFRAWGRIGTTIGSNKLEKYSNLEEAKTNFEDVYFEKTGNLWKDRHNFIKYPKRFSPIDVDYGEKAQNMNCADTDFNSKLAMAVQELIRFIFDLQSMQRVMLEYELDINKMPLGKLSTNQINISYNVLKELQEILKQTQISKTKLLELSNRFYTMMPHNFGMRVPPLIDSLAMVKEKCEMIESLMEIEVAYKLMKVDSASDGDGTSKIDSQYDKLHNRIIPLDKTSDQYKRLEQYLHNTHAPTHRDYKLKIKEIFEVSRDGESDRFHSFKKLPNRMMLWHGSRRTNWAGILSQGLRIAPPEAPVTGYMFGKGIYFADMVSKSANYCHTSRDSADGLLMLCEVAMGKITERTKADENIILKPNEHSCKGLGATAPDPAQNFIDEDGVLYPMGKPVKTKVKSDLLYNEYIVYDIGQVRQRYIFSVNFIF